MNMTTYVSARHASFGEQGLAFYTRESQQDYLLGSYSAALDGIAGAYEQSAGNIAPDYAADLIRVSQLPEVFDPYNTDLRQALAQPGRLLEKALTEGEGDAEREIRKYNDELWTSLSEDQQELYEQLQDQIFSPGSDYEAVLQDGVGHLPRATQETMRALLQTAVYRQLRLARQNRNHGREQALAARLTVPTLQRMAAIHNDQLVWNDAQLAMGFLQHMETTDSKFPDARVWLRETLGRASGPAGAAMAAALDASLWERVQADAAQYGVHSEQTEVVLELVSNTTVRDAMERMLEGQAHLREASELEEQQKAAEAAYQQELLQYHIHRLGVGEQEGDEVARILKTTLKTHGVRALSLVEFDPNEIATVIAKIRALREEDISDRIIAARFHERTNRSTTDAPGVDPTALTHYSILLALMGGGAAKGKLVF